MNNINLNKENHLQNITVDGIMEFKGESFSLYASALGVKLGIDGYAQFVVKSDGIDYKFNNPAIAIEKYSELVRR